MKHTLYKLSLAAALCVGLAACSSPEDTAATKQPEAVNEPSAKPRADVGSAPIEPSKDTVEQQKKQKDKLSIVDIKEAMERGMSRDEVKALVHAEPVVVTGAMDGQPLWRYDIGAKEGYSFTGELDEVDVDGLKQKKLEGLLFVDWTVESKVSSFTLYSAAEDGTIREYRVFENGQVKETTP